MYQNTITGLICELESELREQLKQEALKDYWATLKQKAKKNYWASLKERAKQNYEKNKEIYFEYKNDRKALITLLKTVQDIRQIKDCGKLADELLNIEVASKKNRTQKKVRLFVERLNEIVAPKININKVAGKNTIYDIVLERWALEGYRSYSILDVVFRPDDYCKQLSNIVSSMLEQYKPDGYYPIFWKIRQVLGVEEAGKMIKIKVQINRDEVV